MQDPSIRIEPFFLDSPRGPLFALLHEPAQRAAREGVLYLPPFAEEMHKARRMAALQARALARAGIAVLQIDLTGCGDSAGDFADASWASWRDDARLAHAWLDARIGPKPITLWGLRLGALLAADVAPVLPNVRRLLFWQPVLNGEQFLTQFLRIKLASEMLGEGQAQSGTKTLRAQLDARQPVEVGGYLLSPALADGLARLNLGAIAAPGEAEWMELVPTTGADIAPAGQRVVEAWRGAGSRVATQAIPGEPFWLTQEITECPALIEATLQVFAS